MPLKDLNKTFSWPKLPVSRTDVLNGFFQLTGSLILTCHILLDT